MTPITGKRLVPSEKFKKCFAAAKSFYQRVEGETGKKFFYEVEMLRLFEDEAGRTAFQQRSEQVNVSGVSNWSGSLQAGGRKQIGIRMQQAGRLEVAKYLSATSSYFEERGSYRQVELSEKDLQLNEATAAHSTVMELAAHAVSANRLIMCTGASTTKLFPEVPNNPARGDILTVRIPAYERSEVVHRSIWIAPDTNGTQTVGSTYDWNSTSAEPTLKGRQEIQAKMARIVEGPVDVLEQVAGVRPTMKDYQPVLGRHPKWPNVFILNGLGSKGTLLAPSMAKKLLESMEGTSELEAEYIYDRLKVKSAPGQQSLTTVAQQAVAEILKGGETAIDATVGNGFDTSFLAETVGQNGLVIGFDVQRKAIESTGRRLAAAGLTNVDLREQSHSELRTVAETETVTAVMFNLGFLPRSDKTIVTKAASSTLAIAAALEVLKPRGILTVLAYRGHEGGQDEYQAVDQVLQSYAKQHEVRRIDSQPARTASPVLFILRKKKSND
jgi:glycine oxidase